MQRPLVREEKELLRAAEGGDAATVEHLLSQNASLNVNCVDLLGHTPLRMAAVNEHLEVVEILLEYVSTQQIYAALLHTIKSNHEEISALILAHPRYPEVKKQCRDNPDVETHSEFSADCSPLILAAQYNRYETVMLLLNMGETISHPHSPSCNCNECATDRLVDELRSAKARITRYRGLASEAYISLSSPDPILTAFTLARELRRATIKEKYFKTEYEHLADKLSNYVVHVIDQVRTTGELDAILNAHDDADTDDDDGEDDGKLSRLKLALRYQEKKFVAHPLCQKKLTTVISGSYPFEHLKLWQTVLYAALMVVVYPVLLVLYWVTPFKRVVDFMRTPMVKVMCNTVTHLIFLFVIISHNFREKDVLLRQPRISQYQESFPQVESVLFKISAWGALGDFVVRPISFDSTIIWMNIYVLGLIWQECKQIYNSGAYNYFRSFFNWMDTAMITLYLASFALRAVSCYKVIDSLWYFSFTNQPSGGDGDDVRKEDLYRIYWLIADRYQWDIWDPQTVCEGLFAVANVLSFTRLSYILAVDNSLGPLQLTLGLMIEDVLKFMCIFFIFILAFFVGFHNLYWYYSVDTLQYVQNANQTGFLNVAAVQSFGEVDRTTLTLFWALFGMVEQDVTSLGEKSGAVTETIGVLMFMVYMWTMVVVLLNMLIAMMSKSFEGVSGDQDVEWKFARTRLYVEYMKDYSTVPVPLNLVPTPKHFIRTFRRCCSCLRSSKSTSQYQVEPVGLKITMKDTDKNTESSSDVTQPGTPPSRVSLRHSMSELAPPSGSCGKTQYQTVIRRVVSRYIETQLSLSSVVQNEEIKQDISSFRFEVLNTLKQHESGLQKSHSTLASIKSRQSRLEDSLDEIHRTLIDVHTLLQNMGSMTQNGRSTTGNVTRDQQTGDRQCKAPSRAGSQNPDDVVPGHHDDELEFTQTINTESQRAGYHDDEVDSTNPIPANRPQHARNINSFHRRRKSPKHTKVKTQGVPSEQYFEKSPNESLPVSGGIEPLEKLTPSLEFMRTRRRQSKKCDDDDECKISTVL